MGGGGEGRGGEVGCPVQGEEVSMVRNIYKPDIYIHLCTNFPDFSTPIGNFDQKISGLSKILSVLLSVVCECVCSPVNRRV